MATEAEVFVTSSAPTSTAIASASANSGYSSLPIVDLSPLLASESIESSIKACGEQIWAALSTHGFMYVSGHGVPLLQLDSILETTARFFDADMTVKRTCDAKNSSLYRGYNGLDGKHSCNTKEGKGPDKKESFTVGTERLKGDDRESSPMHGANQWPSEDDLPGWERSVKEYWDTMHKVSKLIMRGMAIGLGANEDFFLTRNDDNVSQLVMIRYPPISNAENNGRCGEHTDCGFLTILHQDQPGLEVWSQAEKKFICADPIPGTFVVNVGDMCSRWTNNRFKSTLHRVNASRNTASLRHSIPFFINCNWNCLVDPQELAEKSEGHVDNSSDFAKPVKAGPYMLQKLGLMWLETASSEQ